MNFDKDKIWLGAPVEVDESHRVGQRPLRTNWIWWKVTNGAEHCENTHKEIKVLVDYKKTSRGKIKMLSNLLRNGKNETFCFEGWSDMFYVPGTLRFELKFFSEIFFRNNVFQEISVPTILSFLDLHENCEKTYSTHHLPSLYGFVGFIEGKHPWRVYSFRKTLFIHPVKSYAPEAATNRRNLEKIVIPCGRKFLHC